MHIENGKKNAAEMRQALLDKALDDMENEYDEKLHFYRRRYIELCKDGMNQGTQEYFREAVMQKLKEIEQEAQNEMERIRSMNNREITLLYCERFPE